MNSFIANVTAYLIVISCNCLFADSTWKLLHTYNPYVIWPKSEISRTLPRNAFFRDNNTTTKIYEPKYRTFNTKIPNNKPNKII